MAQRTEIEWTHFPGYQGMSWNPTMGCSRVSRGCANCYAETIAGRFSAQGNHFHGFAVNGPGGKHWTGRVELVEHKLTEPLRWRKPRCVFVNSMSDLFHEKLSDDDIDMVFAVMALCPDHIFIILTKRAKRMQRWFSRFIAAANLKRMAMWMATNMVYPAQLGWHQGAAELWSRWPLPNVILGVSVENNEWADKRIPHLLKTPAACRMVSAEPLLGPIDLSNYLVGDSNDRLGSYVPCIRCGRGILNRRAGANLETPQADSGQPHWDAPILEGTEISQKGRDISIGPVSDGDVFGQKTEAQGLCASCRLDVLSTARHSGRDAGEPQERSENRLATGESGASHRLGQREALDTRARQGTERTTGREEFIRKTHNGEGYKDQGVGREDGPARDSASFPGLAIDHLGDSPSKNLDSCHLDWVVVGGESGPNSRSFDIAWARAVLMDCRRAGVACFVKQLGSKPFEMRKAVGGVHGSAEALANIGQRHPQQPWFQNETEHWTLTHTPDGESNWYKELKLASSKGGVLDEWPKDLQVRQLPSTATTRSLNV